jgi:hypothetical protein
MRTINVLFTSDPKVANMVYIPLLYGPMSPLRYETLQLKDQVIKANQQMRLYRVNASLFIVHFSVDMMTVLTTHDKRPQRHRTQLQRHCVLSIVIVNCSIVRVKVYIVKFLRGLQMYL